MKKALKIIGISLLALLGIALVVLYIIFPTDTKNTLSYFWQMLNTPLPIVGITTVAILTFVWQFFAHSQYGKKKINECNQEIEKLKKEKEDFVNGANEKIKELLENNAELKGYIANICELSTNIKIKNYGKELLGYGEETTNSNTEEE